MNEGDPEVQGPPQGPVGKERERIPILRPQPPRHNLNLKYRTVSIFLGSQCFLKRPGKQTSYHVASISNQWMCSLLIKQVEQCLFLCFVASGFPT